MIYFFHHYELPVIISQAQVQQILRLRTRQRHQQQNGNGANGAANNSTNIRNGSNTTSNQANNDAMRTNNQMNNNGNNSNNNNHRNGNLLTTLSFILSFQMASTIYNYVSNLFAMIQGRLANDMLGTAAFFNNNNDNSLNNNNNNPTANITRLRINLTRLRRINLAGIQINPIQINPANGSENIRIDRDETANGESMTENTSTTSVAFATTTTIDTTTTTTTLLPETSTNRCNDHITTDEPNHDKTFVNEANNDTKINEHLENAFDTLATDDFDIIDANDELEVMQNNQLPNVEFNSTAYSAEIIEKSVYDEQQPKSNEQLKNETTSHNYNNIQIQSNCSTSNVNIESCNISKSNNDKEQITESSAIQCISNERNLNSHTNTECDESHSQLNGLTVYRADIDGQPKSLEDFSAKSHSWIQGDTNDFSLANSTDSGICTNLRESMRFSSHAAPELGQSPTASTSRTNDIDIHTPNTETTFGSSANNANIHTTTTNNDDSN